jgi:hypothetical protein
MRTLFAALILCVAPAAIAEIEFVGMMAISNQRQFALRSSESGPSRWLKIGDSFGGFPIVGYDAQTDALTLREGHSALTLRLAALEKCLGARPTHSVWLATSGGSSLSFVVRRRG